jgi:hypothetical protein
MLAVGRPRPIGGPIRTITARERPHRSCYVPTRSPPAVIASHPRGQDARAARSTYFAFRVDVWDEAGDNIVEHVAGVDDFETAVATYRAACLRWPKAKITLRQGARVVVRNWRNGK